MRRIAIIVIFLGVIAAELALGHSRLPFINLPSTALPAIFVANLPIVNNFPQQSRQVLSEAVTPSVDPSGLLALLNEKRESEGLKALVQNTDLEQISRQKVDSIFSAQDWEKALSTKTLMENSDYAYKTIGEAYFFAVGNEEQEIVNYWYENAKEVVFAPIYKDIGITTKAGQFQGEDGVLIVLIAGQKYSPIPTPTPVAISEADLWQALAVYRQAHQKSQLQLDDNLCKYARARTQELISRLQNLKPGESPLDGHAGFERDTASGLAFSQTGFSLLAEDLAYDPPATTAVQIIEWGWDSSAPHKESLLSGEVTHGCVTGTYPIYVAILGKH